MMYKSNTNSVKSYTQHLIKEELCIQEKTPTSWIILNYVAEPLEEKKYLDKIGKRNEKFSGL